MGRIIVYGSIFLLAVLAVASFSLNLVSEKQTTANIPPLLKTEPVAATAPAYISPGKTIDDTPEFPAVKITSKPPAPFKPLSEPIYTNPTFPTEPMPTTIYTYEKFPNGKVRITSITYGDIPNTVIDWHNP